MARRDQHGAALVEFALALPVLLLVVVFALATLWATFVQVAAGHAAREGARYATVALPPTYRAHPDTAAVVERVQGRVPVLGLAEADIDVAYDTCPAPCATAPSNAPVVVTVSKTLPGPLRPFARLFGGGDAIVARAEGKGRTE